MSLIENALEKLRRTSAARAPDVSGAARPQDGASAVPSLSIAPMNERPLKHTVIDWKSVRKAGYLPEEGAARRFADFYRHIKRPLIEKALGSDSTPEMRMILLSSSMPGDGKTFTSVNLALSMARERDISVLLIDADLPRANISRVFGINEEPGLTEALTDETLDIESLVRGTDVPGLAVLPAGQFVENATELLASSRMAQIAARLVARYPRRLVLFDSSPLLGSSQTHALARLPGQIALVVRAGVTPRQAILEALSLVDEAKVQGFILNEAPVTRGGSYYYGYYGPARTEADASD
jgi:protein-tyrosine kinase